MPHPSLRKKFVSLDWRSPSCISGNIYRVLGYSILVQLLFPTSLFAQNDPPKDPLYSDFVLLDRYPRPFNLDSIKTLIGYPKSAAEAGIEGPFNVRIKVDTNGKYLEHIILQTPHPIITEAVEPHIPHLRFSPGILQGKKQICWMTIPFQFCTRKKPD